MANICKPFLITLISIFKNNKLIQISSPPPKKKKKKEKKRKEKTLSHLKFITKNYVETNLWYNVRRELIFK